MSDDIEQVRIAVERDMATSGRDEAFAALSRVESRLRDAEAERDDLVGEQGRYLQEWQQMKAERDRLQGMLEQAEEDLNVYLQQTIDVKAENARLRDAEAERDRLRDALERVIGELHETSDLSGLRRKLDFEQKAASAAVIARQALEGDGGA